MRYMLGDTDGERFLRSTATVFEALLQDRLGSIREVLDSSGSIIKTATYDAFGNITTETGSGTLGNFRYAAYLYDTASTLYNMHWRWYNPLNSQWTTEDPWGITAGDANFLRYVGNNGLNATDLNGLDWDPEVVWGKLSEEHRKMWRALRDAGWRIEDSSDPKGVDLEKHKGDISPNRESTIDRKGIMGDTLGRMKFQKDGSLWLQKDTQWDTKSDDPRWEVNFHEKKIWVRAYWNSDATKALQKILPALDKGLKGVKNKNGPAVHYDIDIETRESLEEAYKDKAWREWIQRAYADVGILDKIESKSVKRVLLNAYRQGWNSDSATITKLTGLVPNPAMGLGPTDVPEAIITIAEASESSSAAAVGHTLTETLQKGRKVIGLDQKWTPPPR
jgi:RHS repeat-associated protein